jgi:hypothetical protein
MGLQSMHGLSWLVHLATVIPCPPKKNSLDHPFPLLPSPPFLGLRYFRNVHAWPLFKVLPPLQNWYNDVAPPPPTPHISSIVTLRDHRPRFERECIYWSWHRNGIQRGMEVQGCLLWRTRQSCRWWGVSAKRFWQKNRKGANSWRHRHKRRVYIPLYMCMCVSAYMHTTASLSLSLSLPPLLSSHDKNPLPPQSFFSLPLSTQGFKV